MSATDDDARRPATVLVFTGHRLDTPDRPQPRFPAAAEPRARDLLTAALAQELAGGGPVAGLAGGASGGDILFHEVAADLGIPTELYLALPPEQYYARLAQRVLSFLTVMTPSGRLYEVDTRLRPSGPKVT